MFPWHDPCKPNVLDSLLASELETIEDGFEPLVDATAAPQLADNHSTGLFHTAAFLLFDSMTWPMRPGEAPKA